MQYDLNVGPSLDDPLIRWRRDLSQFGTDTRRALWIGTKLLSFYKQRLSSVVAAGLLVAMLNPVSVVEAAHAAGPTSVDFDEGLADFTFESIEEMNTDDVVVIGFLEKPLVVKTDMGKPEKALIEEQAKLQAKRKRAAAVRAVATTTKKPVVTQASLTGEPITAGNTYPYGYCTWWAKNKRPDLPNRLGNAGRWLANAARAGLPTGSTARAGAIVVTSEGRIGHVGYVEAVEDDEIIVSDMNVIGWGKLSKRRMKAASAVIKGYIY